MVRDKVYLKKKEVAINKVDNLEKALDNARNLNRNMTTDIFLDMEKKLQNKNSGLGNVNYRDVIRYKQ